MFYGAVEKETAMSETYDPCREKEGKNSINNRGVRHVAGA